MLKTFVQSRSSGSARIIRRYFPCTSALVSRLSEHQLAKTTGVINVTREAAGVEPHPHSENKRVGDSAKRQKRQNLYFRQFEVHGGYTAVASHAFSRSRQMIVAARWSALEVPDDQGI